MITSVRVIRWSNIDVFWERPVSCLPTIIKIGQTSFAMFRDPTNKPWARCLCILKSSLGRVLQRFRKNGVIEGDGRGSSAGRQQPPQRPQADGSRRCRQLRAQADGSRRAPGQEAPADVRARAGSPCRRARARRLTGARAGSPCMRAHSAGQRARAPCGLCLPARARPVRAVPACARAPRAGSAGARARAPCGQCLPARAPRADSAGLRGRAGRRQQTGARAQTAPADLRARADSPCRPPRARRQPLPTCARAPWPTTADVRAGLADHCRRTRMPGPTTADVRAGLADHCRCTRMPGPTTADGRACLGRPLPMHVCLRAGMCAGAWAGPCRRGRVGAGGRQQRSRATSGRPVAVHLTFGVCGPGRRPFPPGCRAHSRGRGRRARPRARTTCAAGRGTWTARPVPRVGFSLFHARHHLFRAEARTRSPCGTFFIWDLALF